MGKRMFCSSDRHRKRSSTGSAVVKVTCAKKQTEKAAGLCVMAQCRNYRGYLDVQTKLGMPSGFWDKVLRFRGVTPQQTLLCISESLL